MTTATSRTTWSGAVLVAQTREDHPASRRLQHAGDDDVGRLTEIATAVVDDHHGAVVEIGDTLPGFLPLAHHLHAHRLAGQDHGLERVGQLVDVEHGHAAELRHLVEVVVVGEHLGAQRLAELDQLAVDLTDVGEIRVHDLDLHLAATLQALQDVESALAPVPAQRIGRVRDLLQLTQHELRRDQCPVDEAGLAHVGDAAVDDDGRVEHLRELTPPAPWEEDGRHQLEVGPGRERDDHRAREEDGAELHDRSTSSASCTVATPCASRGGRGVSSRLLLGTTAWVKPSCAASRRRASSPVTARTSPVKPTSPRTTTSPRTGRSM